MRHLLSLTLLWIVLLAGLASGAELFVAPHGDDQGPGTKDRPLATLCGARNAVRRLKAATREPIQVLFRGGTYFLTKEVVFRPEDSGTAAAPITYRAFPGEKPIFSGGKMITGWKPGEGGEWTAEIPEVKQGRWYFRQLCVDGIRRPRARLPQQGLNKVAGRADPPRRAFRFQPGQIDSNWRNRDDVEIVVLQYWSEARQRIASIDPASHVVRFTGDAFRPLSWSLGWYAENVREGLTQPGQWYLDRAEGKLYYRPLPGEDMARAQFVAPVTLRWIRFEGDYKTGKYVEDLAFRGLTFQHTAWDLDRKLGYSYPQASIELSPSKPLWVGWSVDEGPSTSQSQVEVPAGVLARGARRLRFEENEFAHTGAWAIHLAQGGCCDNTIAGNTFCDLGAGAVRIGGPDTTLDDREETRRTLVCDNRISSCANVYFGAPAVWVGQSSGNRVAHNEISGGCEWAVSVGWNWGYMPPNNVRDNTVEYNHCHHIGQSALGTHGVLYFLGVQPGTTARHNLIHDVTGGGSGIVLDNGSAGMVVEHNVVHHVAAHSILFNFNDLGNIVQNNLFAFANDSLMNRAGDAGKLDQTGVFYRNIFCWDGSHSRLFQPDVWANYEIVMDYNVYWDTTGKPPKFLTLSWEEWRKKGLDGNSLIADPRFVDPGSGNFALRPDSPAWKLGFKPIDVSRVGPRAPSAGRGQ
ncbi:MAG: right-handed parallel beta-helix repeat-containing protein [Thermoguttaceae bacterium]